LVIAVSDQPAGRARTVTFVAPRRVEILDSPLPAPANDEVVVETLWSGISSGTELLAYRGEIDPALPLDETIGALGGSFSFPFRYGYSCVGRVARSGGGHSEGRTVFAFHPHQDRLVVPRGDLIDVDGVDPRLATMYPLVETALQIALDAGPVLEETIAVAGLGAVGLLTSLLLQRAGGKVLAVEPDDWRRGVAADLGLRGVTPGELPAAAEDEAPGGLPLVIECSGRPAVLAELLPLLAHEGEALVVSWYGTKAVPLPLGREFHRRRLRLRSTQVSTIPAALGSRWNPGRRRAVARRLLGELPLAALATHAFAFEAADQAYAALDEGTPRMLHVALGYE
jgi:2-desacetyl-2-hydroxyethyl bacteriochlorophyllide A dehydrogenase